MAEMMTVASAAYEQQALMQDGQHRNSLEMISSQENTAYLLERTALPIKSETDILERLLYESIEKKTYLAIVNEWLTNTGENFFHFSREHIQGRPLLGFLYSIKSVDGIDRLIAPKNSDAVVADISSFEERYGAQKMAIVGNPYTKMEGFESFLLRAPEGSIVVRTSPLGWSGYPGYSYAEAQTQFMVKVKENGKIKIKGYNIRTMTDVEQSENFLENLGVAKQDLERWTTEEERLANVTGINVYFPADTRPGNLKDLVEELHKISGDVVFNNHSFEQVIKDMEQFDELINMDVYAAQGMDMVKTYVIQELMRIHEEVIRTRRIPIETVTNIQKVYGTMVLEFATRLDFDKKPMRVDDSNVAIAQSYSDDVVLGYSDGRYDDTLKQLQASSGCPGITSKSDNLLQDPILRYLENPFGGVLVEFNSLESFIEICKKIKCGRKGCGWEPNELQVKEVGKSITECPDCRWKPGDSTAPLIDIKAKQNKMTIFTRQKEATHKETRSKLVKREELNKEPDNTIIFSIKLFQGSLTQLQNARQKELISNN